VLEPAIEIVRQVVTNRRRSIQENTFPRCELSKVSETGKHERVEELLRTTFGQAHRESNGDDFRMVRSAAGSDQLAIRTAHKKEIRMKTMKRQLGIQHHVAELFPQTG